MADRPRAAACAVATAAVLAVSLAGGAAGVAGCFTHQCDSSTVDFDGGTTVTAVDGTVVWTSGPETGPWIDLTPQETLVITFPQPFAAAPADIDFSHDCQVSPDPVNPQNGFAPCGTGIVQFSGGSSTGITVTNLTCAAWGLRFQVRSDPGASAAVPEAGGAPEAASGD